MTVLMSALSWVAYQERLQDDSLVLLLPCGALEQHGPHLPLGTDALLSAAIAQSVATNLNGLVAPTLSYGYKSQPKSGGGQHFPGTTSLDGQSLSQITRDVIREFARHGVKNLVVVDGHYENQWFLTEGIDLAMRELGTAHPLSIMRLEYWDFCTEETLSHVFPDGFPGFALEHAAVIETSLMLHFCPDLVALDRLPTIAPANFPPYDMYPTRTEWVPQSGVLSSAKGASAEKGRLMAEQLTESITKAIRHEFSSVQ
ncbi:MAG: creatininase [Tildeniella nuda ZEHNDER 1965/U140]|jgi:creatinine amidohydrolase|nr:creatininase [Tildeniella nuda ZEHNDER 1965/U140]